MFYNGNDYRQLADVQKTAYVVGLFDGLVAAGLLGATDVAPRRLATCFGDDLPQAQLRAIVDKFLDEHPERWGEPMNLLLWASLPQQCRK
jgi:hypothetical protein